MTPTRLVPRTVRPWKRRTPEPPPPGDDEPVAVIADDPAETTPGSAKPVPAKRSTPWWKETILLVGTALILALIIKTFFVQAFYIPSGSMENTLKVNDRILVEKVSYWFGSPQRGDIIVFKDPANWLGEEGGSEPSNPLTKALSFVGSLPRRWPPGEARRRGSVATMSAATTGWSRSTA